MKYTSDNTEKSNLRLALDAMRVSIDFLWNIQQNLSENIDLKSFRNY